MSNHRKHLLASTIIAGLAVGVMSPALALAQAAAPLATTDQSAPEETEVEALVVTGSRIKRSEFNSPDPIQVINAEQGKLKGIANTGALLRTSTVASGSPQITSAISSAFVTDGGPGSETISLRGLGANRTLVLINGRRLGPSGVRGGVSAVDLNTIPSSAIDRIDILKDGASSIYGSDAVAGVVNIITKRDTDGFEIDAFVSQPQRHGGEEYRGSLAWGKTFSKGFFSASYEYSKTAEQRIGDRKYTNCGQPYTTNAQGKRTDAVDPRTGKTQCRDLLYDQIWLYDFNFSPLDGKLQYDYGNNLGQFIPPVPPGQAAAYPGFPPGFFTVGYGVAGDTDLAVLDYNSPFNLASSLTPRTERHTVYLTGAYDITDSVEAYGEVLLNRRSSKTNGYRQFWSYFYTGDYDPFSAGFTGDFILSPTPVTNFNRAGQKVDYQRYLGGLRGDFGGVDFLKGWDWDIFAQHSHSKGLYSQDVILDDALRSSAFRTGSCAGTITPISKRKCVDVSWVTPDFLAGKYTPEEQAFLFDSETGKTIYKQFVVEGSASGNLFSLPAGPIGAAVGFHYRRESINDTPGDITLAGNIWNSSSAGITAGKDKTKEVFGELSVPLLKDLPFAQSVDLSLSGRYTDVDSYGSDSTYKIGLNWQLMSSLRLRATKGTSFRAPALFELYKNAETSFPSQRSVDPCIRWTQNLAQGNISQRVADNCKSAGIPGAYSGAGVSATASSSGGAGALVAETSDAKTYGVIWTPGFANLNVALDYFDITVKNEITQLGSANIVDGCYRSLSFPTDPLCGLFTRHPTTFNIVTITDNYLNIADQTNRGIDLTVRYGTDLPWDTKLTVDMQSTWQLKDTTALSADNVIDSNGFVGDPDWTGQLNFRLERGDITAFWGIDMVGKASDAEDYADTAQSGAVKLKVHTEFTAYHNLSLQKKFDEMTLLVGVANVFDEAPPAVSQSAGNYSMVGSSVLASQYDYIGRRAFVNITAKF
ncbi:TonB-dependent receptor plug domain-containing protein [Caulobacter sp. DWR1-3-2b1]|uniref:TonB-dependent receptor plug domain-containing protein n=1 Tax=Caulobacter sp. DWR1-3-2b1 TaxID=2804670 RepID=UPI003CF0EBB7